MHRSLLVLFLLVSLSAGASTYTVNDFGDAGDANAGDDVCNTGNGPCTLRAAIQEANAHAGVDTVEFTTGGLIAPATPLPSITQPITIDGTSASDYLGVPVVRIDGAGSSAIGLHFALGSNNSALVALEIAGFTTAGVVVAADGVSIRRNYLGPVSLVTPNLVGLQLNSGGSTIGGADGEGNVISGNSGHGIAASGTDHFIRDNFIGLDPTGLAALPNGDDGINVLGSRVTIGSATAGEENVISGNDGNGVTIDGGVGTVVAGNYIGLDAAGTAAVPNFIGVQVNVPVLDAPPFEGNTVGTTAARNVISGNDDDGIAITGHYTIVHNNIIGTDVTGLVGIGNLGRGIDANSVTNIAIGGSGPGEDNLISSNGMEGVLLIEVRMSRVTGNMIGLDANGTSMLGNALDGIRLSSGFNVTFASNVISGNSGGGVFDLVGISNIYELNQIGTTAGGLAALGNLGTGIEIYGGAGAIVRSNVVSANGGHGIETTLGAVAPLIHSNIVGLSADLSTPLGNTLDGINICDGTRDAIVGTAALGGNIISGNLENGIGVESSAAFHNSWAANSIYDNGLLGIDIGIDGVTLNDPDDPDPIPPGPPPGSANNYQNFPDLTLAVTTPASSQILGTLNTKPNTAFTVQFYSSPAADPSGFGEGRTYLGEIAGTTDANGDAAFAFTGPALTPGEVVTATATAFADGSSEFSAAITIDEAPVIAFSSPTYTVGEAGVSQTITVTRTGNLGVVSTVDYATSDNTATAGSDYTAASGTLTFVAGDDIETFVVPITDDMTDEPDEIVNLTLSNPTVATLADPPTAQLTITDDEVQPTITIDDVSAAEGSPVAFTLTLSHPSASDVTVNFTTADDTATAGSDYTAQTDVATITAGNLTTTINVGTTADTTFESDETFFVNLTGSTNAAISDNQGLGTITDDDGADLTITKTTASPTFTPGDPVTFTITVQNLGPAPAMSLIVTDVLPAGTTLVSATGPGATCSGTSTVTCTIPTLASGASTVITLTVNATSITPIANTASVTTDPPTDPTPVNNAATATVSPTGIDEVPTMTEWGLMLLALGLAFVAMRRS